MSTTELAADDVAVATGELHPATSAVEISVRPRRVLSPLSSSSVAVILALVVASDAVVAYAGAHAVRGPLLGASALLLPGLSVTSLLDRRRWSHWEIVLWSVGWSLVWLMFGGLVLVILPAAGDHLSVDRVLAVLNLGVVAPLGASLTLSRGRRSTSAGRFRIAGEEWWQLGHWRSAGRKSAASLVALPLSVVSVILAVLGAHQLNARGSNQLTLIALVLVGVSAAARALDSADRPSIDAFTLYMAALAVLLATSLRGDAISGHDIATEYRVFTQTALKGTWHPGGLFPGYNSCLSITILPTMLLRLTAMGSADVFRVLFQTVFAASAPLVYAIARRWTAPWVALLAGVLFISFPTFVNDMSWIDRQEIALVPALLLILVIVDHKRGGDTPALLVVSGAGVIVSHYSTTYLTVATLTLATLIQLILARLRRRALSAPTAAPSSLLSLPLVVLLLAGSAAWGAWTGTGNGLVSTVRTTMSEFIHGSGPRQGGTGYLLIDRPKPLTPRQALSHFVAHERASKPKLFEHGPVPANCQVAVLASAKTPITSFGASLEKAHLAPGSVVGTLREAAVVLFEVGAVAGLLAIRRANSPPQGRGRDLFWMATSSLAVLAVDVVLPQLSVSYGVLRVYQQELALLAPAIVLVLFGIAGAVARRRRYLVISVVVGTFLVTSGVVPEIIGGYGAQLNLNNSGSYYDAYYVSSADLSAAQWLQRHPPDNPVITDLSGLTVLQSETTLPYAQGLYPGLTPKDAVLFVRLTQGGQAKSTIVYDNQTVSYSYPVNCLGTGRPVIYRNRSREILGPAKVA